MTPPTITHLAEPLPSFNNKMFRHTASLLLTDIEVTPLPTHNTTAQDKRILSLLYSPLHIELAEIRTLFSLDPTRALRNFDSLLTNLQSQIQ